MARKRELKYLVKVLCEGEKWAIHGAVENFVGNELRREKWRIKKRGVKKYKKEFDEMNEALEGFDEYIKRVYDMMYKFDKVRITEEVVAVDEVDEVDDENVDDANIFFQNHQGNGGNQ
jgi:hypothetical protein